MTITVVNQPLEQIEGLKEGGDEVILYFTQGGGVKFHHVQDCCETVTLVDFECDIDLTKQPTLLTIEEISNEDQPTSPYDYSDGSFTWTFYKVETTHGSLWMRWLGESNGYYSEEVDMVFFDPIGTNPGLVEQLKQQNEEGNDHGD